MDGNIQKALWLGVGIMVFLAVVAIGMAALSKGQNLSEESMAKLDDTSRALANADYNIFDNQMKSGTDAVNAVKKFRAAGDDIGITIDPLSGTDIVFSDCSAATDASIKSLQETINLYGDFYATVQHDGNGNVETITFTQE